MSGNIPLVDLGAAHAQVAADVADGWARVLATTAFVGGPQVAEFEAAYADYVGVAHCVGVGNGTDAIELALRALDIGPGDEVILPANTFIATAEAVARAGATPVLADCRPDTALLDIESAVAAVTARTRAVLPVHLYGQAADVERPPRCPARVGRDRRGRRAVAGRPPRRPARRLTRHHRRGPASTRARISAPTATPEPSSPTTRTSPPGSACSATTARRASTSIPRSDSTAGSIRCRLSFSRRKLRRLDASNEARRAAAARYDALLGVLPQVIRPRSTPGNVPVWHLYVVQVPDRDRVLASLTSEGIGAGIHYPTPLHMTGAFDDLGKAGDFPVAEALSERILSPPLFPEITEAQQERVVAALGGR